MPKDADTKASEGVLCPLEVFAVLSKFKVRRSGQLNVYSWTDIIDVAAGSGHSVGVKSDGTVVAVGGCNYSTCNVSSWTDIIDVAAGYWYTVGLKSDGSVVAVGCAINRGQCDVSSWTDIIQLDAGELHTVGLKSYGRVVAVGENSDGQCNVAGWNLGSVPYPYLTVISPNGGEVLSEGATFEITWTSEGEIQYVNIDYSLNGGANWIEIAKSAENDGSYDWEVPNNPSDECLVRISDVDGDPYGESDAVFTITPPICEGDFDSDGDVDGSDLTVFAEDFGRTDCSISD